MEGTFGSDGELKKTGPSDVKTAEGLGGSNIKGVGDPKTKQDAEADTGKAVPKQHISNNTYPRVGTDPASRPLWDSPVYASMHAQVDMVFSCIYAPVVIQVVSPWLLTRRSQDALIRDRATIPAPVARTTLTCRGRAPSRRLLAGTSQGLVLIVNAELHSYLDSDRLHLVLMRLPYIAGEPEVDVTLTQVTLRPDHQFSSHLRIHQILRHGFWLLACCWPLCCV